MINNIIKSVPRYLVSLIVSAQYWLSGRENLNTMFNVIVLSIVSAAIFYIMCVGLETITSSKES